MLRFRFLLSVQLEYRLATLHYSSACRIGNSDQCKLSNRNECISWHGSQYFVAVDSQNTGPTKNLSYFDFDCNVLRIWTEFSLILIVS